MLLTVASEEYWSLLSNLKVLWLLHLQCKSIQGYKRRKIKQSGRQYHRLGLLSACAYGMEICTYKTVFIYESSLSII